MNPLGLLPLAAALTGLSGGPAAEVAAQAERSDLSLAFEAGDDDELVHRGPGYELRVGAVEASLRFGATECVRFVGPGSWRAPVGAEPLAGRALDYDAIEAGGPRTDTPIYRRVRGDDEVSWRATVSGVTLDSPAGARWTIDGADSVAIEDGLAVFQCASGTVTLTAPGAGLRVLAEGMLELSMGSEAALEISPRPLRCPLPDDGVYVTVDAYGFRYLAGRAPGGEGVPPVFVTKLAPDDATLVWTLRFDPGDGYRLTGIELDDAAGVEVFGTQGSNRTATSIASDGDTLHVRIVRDPRIQRAHAVPPALVTRWGDESRGRAVADQGDTVVVAGTTIKRVLPGATIVQPDARGENVFIATVPSVPEAPQTAGCPGTINFDNSAGTGAWTTATNWDLDRLPDPTDDVCIGAGFSVALSSGTQSIQSLTTDATATLTLSGTTTLNLASASTFGGALTMTNGTLGGAGNVTISGLFTWGAGTLSGGGTTHANGGISFTGSPVKDLSPRVLENNATAAWAGTGGIRLGGGSSIVNSGTWDAQGNAQFSALTGGGTFTNAGTFKKSGGTGTTTIMVGFDSAGPIDIQAGTLSINGSGTASGAITGSAATTLRFNGSSAAYTLSASSSVAVPTVVFDAGTVDINGSYAATSGTTVSGAVTHFNSTATVSSIGSNLTISSGMADFSSGETISPSTMTLSGGTLLGTDTVTVSGLLTWTAGAMAGGAVTNADGGIAFANSSVKDLNPRVVKNAGTAIWTGTGSIRLGGGSTIENNGIFDTQGDGQIVALGGGGSVTNVGTLRKSAGAAATTISVPLNSSGPIEILAGTLTLSGGGTASSTVTGSPGTTLRFNAVVPTFTLTSSSSVAASSVTFDGGTVDVNGAYAASATTTIGGGTNRFNSQATVSSIGSSLTLTGGIAEFNSGDTIAPSTLTMLNGTLQGGDTVTISGLLTWAAGTISGSGIINANGGISISTSAVKDLNQRLLRNAGTAAWAGAGALRMGGGATLENNGIWDAQGDASIVPLGGGGTFTSPGTLRKSAGTGTTGILVPFDASGPVEIQTGTISFDGGSTLASAVTGSSGATLRFGGISTTNVLASTSSVSVGSVVFAGSATTVAGAYAATNGTTVEGGAVSFLPSATVSSIGSALTVTGGSASFASGETISPTSLSMSGGSILGTDTIDVSGLTTWAAGQMSGGITNTNGGLSLTGTAIRDLDMRTLRTAGTTTWSGVGGVRLGNGSTIENSGTWEISGNATIFALTGGGSVANSGTFRKSGGASATIVSVPFTTSGSVVAGVGTLSFSAGFTQIVGSTVQSGGTISSTTPLDIQGGTLAGIGAAGASVVSSGNVTPGLSPGILGISGAFTSSPTAHMTVELGGTTVGTQYDQLNVTGAAAIDGTLDASLVGGFVPVAGDLFTIVSGASRTGTFATTNLPSLPPFLVWNVIYLPTAVQLKAVPLPSGRVPGDNALEPPVTVGKSGANIVLTWSAGCLGTDSDSEIYEGSIGSFTSHVPITCTTAGATTSTFAPGAGSRYYLVVPTNGAGEGSYGLGVGGAQRPVSASACHLQSVAACP